MTRRRGPSRRLFLTAAAATGGGLALGIRYAQAWAQVVAKKSPPGVGEGELNVWVIVRADDTIAIRVARSELGQGSLTGLAQLVAEGLDCDWTKVSVEQPLPGANAARNRVWRDFATTNSRSIRTSHEYLRLAGLAARVMLRTAAAEQWNVSVAEVTTDNGKLSHAASQRTTTYGRMAMAAARLEPPTARTLSMESPIYWKIAGKAHKRLDTRDKISGRAIYGIDIRLPDMLNASIRQAPVFGAVVQAFEADAVSGLPGVRHVLQVGDTAVAVVADTWWQAEIAIERLPITWSEPPEAKVSSASIADFLKEGLDVKEAFIGHTHGDALKAIAGAATRVDAVYGVPFVHHATLEPMSCTARWMGNRIDVWTATQSPEAALRVAADTAGVPISAAEVHRVYAGGSFGRRIRHDFIKHAVLIARQVPDRPVKLIWSRAEDTQHGSYRPISQFKVSGAVDDKGDVVGLIVRISGQSVSASQTPQSVPSGRDVRMFHGLFAEAGEAQIGYSIPNLYIDHAMRNTHVPVGSWRGGHGNQNAFMLECFVDELAKTADRDPLEFRRAQMKSHPRHLAVLNAAAERAKWNTAAPAGMHRGIAQCMSFGTYTAAVAEVSVDTESRIRVHRVVMAIDCGHVVNPELVTAQAESSVAFALSAMFHQEITLAGGRVVEADFDSHGVIRMGDMPVVETVLVPSGEVWGGVGSSLVAVVTPAVINGIFAASGKRVRALPVRDARLP